MIKGSPIQKPIFNSTERRRQEVVKKEFAAKAAEAAKEKKHLKDLILFGLENSSEPVIKNPVMRAALEAKPKSVNYLSDNYSFAQNFKKQSKNINDYKPKTPLAITPKKRNYWDATMELNVGNKGPLKLPELTAEEIERANQPSDWDVIYGSMSPFQKGTWNSEQRNKKLQRQKEEAEDKAAEEPSSVKMAKEIVEHVIPSSSVVRKQESNDHYPGAVSAEDSISKMAVEHAIRPKNHGSGLSESFVKEKMAEAKIIKDVLGE